MKILQDFSLKNLNTFGVQVKAKLFAEIFSNDELIEFISDKNLVNEKILVLGGGSNILFTKDFDGLVLKLSIPGIKNVVEDDETVIIEAGCGVIWNDLVQYCVANNYAGVENLSLIPGTVGAAPIQNIGAYGQELADNFEELSGVMIATSERKVYGKSDCKFSYRSSIFKEELKNKFIITSIRLKLTKNSKPNLSYKTLSNYFAEKGIANPSIKEIADAVSEIRKSKLPDPEKVGNAGSFFKNPVVDKQIFNELKSKFEDIVHSGTDSSGIKISAGWLIEKCGWKGKRIGSVGTAPDHALVICNYGNATGTEIIDFANRIKSDVKSRFGITLQEEVNII